MPRVLTLDWIDGKPGEVYYPLRIKQVPKPAPGPGELLVRLRAAALNHRDLFQRRRLYPGISFEAPLLTDGCGIIVQMAGGGEKNQLRIGQTVILMPMRDWLADPDGPELQRPDSAGGVPGIKVIGSSRYVDAGAAQDYVVVGRDEVEPAPAHLSAIEAAALPLVGLTAWRALVTKAGCGAPSPSPSPSPRPLRNLPITGIGGGVALQALQFAVALGICRVFVTSGDAGKLQRACRELGASGGVLYRDAEWDARLRAQLPDERPFLDVVLDGNGADIVVRCAGLLRPGGVIVQYGMTAAPRMEWHMRAVLDNLEIKGSTMGSRREFRDMLAFVDEKRLRPIVSRTVRGLSDLDAVNSLFSDMDAGRHFGKLVIEIDDQEDIQPKL